MTAFSSLDCPRRDEVDEDEDALERLERRKSFLGWIVGAFLAMPRDTVCLVAVREAEGLGAMDREGRGLCVAGRKRSLCRIAQGRKHGSFAGAVGFFWELRDRDREVSNGEFRKSNPGELLNRPC